MNFKNANGLLLTLGLFHETSDNPSSAPYTLKPIDWAGKPSLRRLYLETLDPTEHTFASLHLDGWVHWQRLLQAPWFLEHAVEWRKELDLKIKARALKKILDFAESGNKGFFEANKWLVDSGYKPGEGKSKVGRPTKDEIKRQANQLFTTDSLIREDAERLGVH